ncbi:creatininase family protein [Oryzifoliimicrobium ureilyticus]|uniref:creatininase family protein n=1 Tax=Oryzifoliimicrobium ureilyticus TaxID=3113724 RepID=UPI003076132F
MHLPCRRFADNDPKLPADDRKAWIAVLPLGAHEQHGPHLPFETDTLIAAGIVERLERELPSDLPVTFLPVEPIGYSPEHMDISGTQSLTYSEAIERWLTIAQELSAAGIKKFVMLNAHGGNSPLMAIVAMEARRRLGILAVATSWTRFGIPAEVIPPQEKAIDIHAGDVETSVMLALHPDKVDMSRAASFSSRQSVFEQRFRHLRAYGPHAFGWMMTDLNREGAAGDASKASAKKGEKLLTHAVRGLVELFRDIAQFDEPWLRSPHDKNVIL